MPAVCSICVHSGREAIDSALILATESYRTVAKRYGVSPAALVRHRRNHAARAVRKAQEVREYRSGEKLLDRVENLAEKSWGILEKAENVEDFKTAISGVVATKGVLELIGRLSGELDAKQEGQTNNYLTILNFLRSDKAEQILAPAVEIEGGHK